MAINKVVYGQQTLIDLTQDTVTSAAHIVQGYTGHLADGSVVTGTAPKEYTATVGANGGAVRYVRYNETTYRTEGETFTFDSGESLFVTASDNMGGYGEVYIDGVRVASAQGSARYTYVLPSHDITISFDYRTAYITESSSVSLQSKTVSYTPTETAQSATVTADSGYDGLSSVDVSVGAISSSYVGSGIDRRSSSDLTASGATVTVPSGYYASQATKSVASGTEGTPTATKGSVSNHSVSVTPSVTNVAGYISGGTKTGTAVTVSASELVSGSETKTANGTYDVTNLASIVINVPSGGGWTVDDIERDSPIGDIVSTNTSVRIYAYAGSSITSYTNNTITTLNKSYEFHQCKQLTSVHLPQLTTINTQAFNGCSALTSLAFPSLTTLSSYNNFSNCSNLTTIDFGNLTRIRTYSFQSSSKLRTIILRKTSAATGLEAWSAVCMGGIYSNPAASTIYVPSALIDTYKAAANWVTAYNAGLTFAAIEKSQYENYYADGTAIS